MSDTTQSPAMNLLQPSAGSAIGSKNSSATPFADLGGDHFSGNTFSRELTRATDRAQPDRFKAGRSRGDHDEPAVQHKTHNPESTKRSDASAGSRTDSRDAADRSQNESTSSRPAGSETEHSKRTGQVNGEQQTRTDAGKADADTENGSAQTVSEGDEHESTLPREEGAVSTDAATVSVAETSAFNEVPETADADGVLSAATGVLPSTQATSSGTEASSRAATHPDTSIQSLGLTASSAANPKGVADKAAAQAVTAGQQLTPAELATRQAHLLNHPMSRDRTSGTLKAGAEANSLTSAIDDSASLRIPAGAASAAINTVLPTAQSGEATSRGTSDMPRAVTATMLQAMAEKSGSDTQLTNVRAREAAELSETRMAALKNEQQVIQANLAQTQLQARQQTLQAMANLTAPATVSESADAGSQSPDNMFLSLNGGIVTAPVLQRVDSAGTQSPSAPLNMPILQNDADKAMAGNIRWMVNEGVRNAVVNVTPSGMGPISVTVGMENDQMNVSIVALQGSTREALDSMLPRLREQLAAQGHESVKVDISDGRSGESDRGYAQQESDAKQGSENSAETSGLVDSGSREDKVSDQSVDQLANRAQEWLSVDSNGQLRGRYDVYV